MPLTKGLFGMKVYHQNNQPYEFSDINILYGRNYSGKTTLSRIIRAFEKGYEGMKQYYQKWIKTNGITDERFVLELNNQFNLLWKLGHE